MITREEMFQMKTVYKYIPKNITVKKDIIYQETEPERSKMDIYYAQGRCKADSKYTQDNIKIDKKYTQESSKIDDAYETDRFPKDSNTASAKLAPTVILVHGEMRNMPDMKEAGEYTSLGEAIASAGMNAVTFNHRVFSDGVLIAEVISDIRNLIAYVIEHAKELHLDAEHIAVWSFSGGVPYGLAVGLCGMYPTIQCLVAYYGFADFEVMKQCLLDREVEKEQEIESPITLLQKHKDTVPPMLIARAGLDSEVLNATMESFIREALRNNLSVDLYNHPTGHHAFDIFDENARTQEIMERTIEFLLYHLSK